MLTFFNDNPFIPLRVLITSRVEQHIQFRLNGPRTRVETLHCSNEDIAALLDALFKDAWRQSHVIQAYVSQYGEWPNPHDKDQLVQHISGSFVFAWQIFKFIMGIDVQNQWHTSTPMGRLPQALRLYPSLYELDRLYDDILTRSEHLPHFFDVISTVALLWTPLPTSGIAQLLGVHTYEVVNVLMHLQPIIQGSETDRIPVTICHTSLRDFLTTENRSGRFFAHPSLHARLFLRCVKCELEFRRRMQDGIIRSDCPAAVRYALGYSTDHLAKGDGHFWDSELNTAIQLRREALRLLGEDSTYETIHALADVMLSCFRHTPSMAHLEEAIRLYRETLNRLPASCPDPSIQLNCLGNSLLDRFRLTRSDENLQEAISLFHKALEFRPWPHPKRSSSLTNLGNALRDRYRHTRCILDLEEAIRIIREAFTLQGPCHPGRAWSLNLLAGSPGSLSPQAVHS